MDLQDFKREYIRQELGITDDFGRVCTFLDFANVNNWFEDDRQDADGNQLAEDEKLEIDIAERKNFISLFSNDIRFYYGHDQKNPGSLGFIRVARGIYGKHRVFTKPVQEVRHHLTEDELPQNTRPTHSDKKGTYVFIPKCNFDVEISVDAVKTADHYDTLCLFSSDADFVHLARYLKGQGKNIVLVKGGHIVHEWKAVADKIVNAQKAKRYITFLNKKQRPDE